MRLIDADELAKVKFHALPYTHITPSDLTRLQTEAYERGWNDSIDAIMENAETVDAPDRKVGKWIHGRELGREMIGDCITAIFYEGWKCSACGCEVEEERQPLWHFCPHCGAEMRQDDPSHPFADDMMMGGEDDGQDV